MELTPQERELCERVGFDKAVAQRLKAVTEHAIEQAFCYDYEIEPEPENALSCATDAAYPNLETVRAELPDDYRAYIGIRREPNGLEIGPEIVVLRDTDPLAFVRCRRPDGANYHISAKDVLAKLEDWHARFGLDIVRADHDQVEMNFQSLPADLMAFAEEVFWFCEDVTDVEGDEMDIERDPDLLARARELSDVSPAFRARYNEQMREAFDDYDLGEAIGLKLLAAQLERERNLFLWWD